MPSIEISQAQADALARGENITLESPQRTVRNVVVVPKEPRPDWMHTYHVEEGVLESNGFLRFVKATHMTDKHGKLIMKPAANFYESGLMVGSGAAWVVLGDAGK